MYEDFYLQPRTIYFAAEDTSFVTGDSPVVLDVKTALSKVGTNGYIINDGAGDLYFSISPDGNTYRDNVRLKYGEEFPLTALSINLIKITWIEDSSYRVYVE